MRSKYTYQPYPYNPTDGRERNDDSTSVRRGVRGGSFYYDSDFLRSASRNDNGPNVGVNFVGLRCVRSHP